MDDSPALNRKLEDSKRLWWGRLFIGVVIFTNIQCALAFFLDPSAYILAYELSGTPGEYAIQGFGILFLMWSVPYFVAFAHPHKYRISLIEAVVMQFIGLLGESYLLFKLPSGYPNLASSILRFIVFDGLGLIFLFLAMLVTSPRPERAH
jgi:hypothetical protein